MHTIPSVHTLTVRGGAHFNKNVFSLDYFGAVIDFGHHGAESYGRRSGSSDFISFDYDPFGAGFLCRSFYCWFFCLSLFFVLFLLLFAFLESSFCCVAKLATLL